jgi:hypothetical protein
VVGFLLAAGCAVAACGSRSAIATPVTTAAARTRIDAAAARRIAESYAVTDDHGRPVLSAPTRATSMTFEQAERSIGSGADYSLPGTARVWLVHVYGEFASPRGRPPPPPWAKPSPTTTGRRVAPSYYVILDADSGSVHVLNY